MDLFASYENRKVNLYCSREPEQGAFHSDALTLDWSQLDAYAFPSTPLIHLVLDRIERYPGVVTLIDLYWPRRSWLPRLLDLLVDFPIQLPVRPDLLQQWKGRSGIRIQANSDWWPVDWVDPSYWRGVFWWSCWKNAVLSQAEYQGGVWKTLVSLCGLV